MQTPISAIARAWPHCTSRHIMDTSRSLGFWWTAAIGDRKSTRLNSSHTVISYAVFCLKKKEQTVKCLHTGNSYAVFALKKKMEALNTLLRRRLETRTGARAGDHWQSQRATHHRTANAS